MSAEVGSSDGLHSDETGGDTAAYADAAERFGGAEIGPYRIVGVLGDGGMGTVYEGLQPDIERWVAIKVLHAELAVRKDAQARLQQEARVTNRVAHPGLVQISEVGRLPTGQLYLVMDLLRGETIADRLIRNKGMLPLCDTVSVGIQLAEILLAAHQRGVVHRDTSIKTKICLRKGDIAIHRRRTDHAYLPFTH
jgi:serine/threonine-protein kinase